MTKYRQRISHPGIGDCFRACMATLLDLPPEVLPNDFSPAWPSNWQHYLRQFGLALSPSQPNTGPIWMDDPWIATVKSLNYPDTLHAILVHQANVVYHDPSTRVRYRTGTRLATDQVVAGRHLVVADASRLQHLADYQQWLRVNGGAA